MPVRRELLSPASTARVSRLLSSPSEFATPSTRFATPSVSSTLLGNTVQNDDEAEKRARRRSKVLELQRVNIASPSTPVSERRRSMPLNGLSNVQLAEHYADCIKLSAENKITSKNAFGLHLIDYMSDLLKNKELNNFQVASSTLDASTKIYAGRVDAIHSETYKVLSGLGRSNKAGEKENENGGDDLEQDEEIVQKKQKRARKSNTVETNLKNINVKRLDTEVEVDPLFSKTSASFDEGGTNGLLLNHLRCIDDNSALAFDSETVLPAVTSEISSQTGKYSVNLKDLRDLYGTMGWDDLQICPPFADFKFTDWSKDSEDTFTTYLSKMTRNEHAFDLNKEPEPITDVNEDLDIDTEGNNMEYGDSNSFCADDGGGDDYDENSQSEKTVMMADGQEAKLVKSAMNSIKHGTVGVLMQVLAAEPGEYSYFKTDVLNTWAGPAHWKLRPRSRDVTVASNVTSIKREKKAAFQINYTEEKDFDACFKESKRSTTLTKSTLDKYSKTEKTLPEDLHYDADKLFSLFVKPKIMVKRQDPKSENLDDDIDNYDYDNPNDRENFCPALMDGQDDDEDNGSSGIDLSVSAGEFQSSQGSFLANDTMFNNTQLNGTLLAGDNLVAQPHKVAKIDIAYARTAKKMDVKKLKSCMWDILTSSTSDKENQGKIIQENTIQENTTEKTSKEGLEVSGDQSFQQILEILPEKLSQNMARNLSVPIAFVCLLHLANEKTLKISSDSTMSDFKISQGI